MSFVQPQSSATRHSVGIGVAFAFHIVLVWALTSGLARKAVHAINAPMEAKIIEEVNPPPLPPPPPKVIEMRPPPKFTPPPPAFVPLPEVKVQAPSAPITITATSPEPPTVAPVAMPQVEEPAAPPSAPARVSASVACSNFNAVMGDAAFPREATRAGLEEGNALIQFTLAASGEIKDIKTVRASHPAFENNSIRLVSKFKCAGQGRDVLVQVPFVYKSE
jgi:protein TonB